MRSVLSANHSEKFCAETVLTATAQKSVKNIFFIYVILLLFLLLVGHKLIAHTLYSDDVFLADFLA